MFESDNDFFSTSELIPMKKIKYYVAILEHLYYKFFEFYNLKEFSHVQLNF